MACFLKQSTAIEIKLGPFVDSTDGFTAETALTITQSEVLLAKNDGDWAQKNEATSLVHESNGWYRCLLNTTDTNTLGILLVQVAESGALPVWREFMVLPAMVYDSLVAGTDDLDTNTKKWNDLTTVALPLVPTTAGRTLDVSVTGEAGVDWANVGSPTTTLNLSGTTIAVTQKVDVETIKTQTVTCGAGVTVLASVGTAATSTAQTGDSFARLTGTGAVTFASLTVTGTTTHTGNVAMANGLTISRSSSNTVGLTITGNGTGAGVAITGGATGAGIDLQGGATSGSGLLIATNNGIGISIAATGNHAIEVLAFTSAKDAINLVGGASAAGIRSVGGLGGAGIVCSELTVTNALTAGSNAVPWNASWDAEVQSECADALAVYDPPTNAEMEARTIVSASYATATALDTVDNFIDTEIGTIITHLTDIKGATFSGVTDSLEAIRDRGDSAWSTATGFSTHSAADVWSVGTRVLTAGTNIQLPSNGLANVSAWTVAITGNITGNLSGSVGSVTGLTAADVAAIKAKTDSLTFTVAGKADVNVLYVNSIQIDGVGSEADPWGPI